MMASPPNSESAAPMRLDVRLNGGRAVGYPLGEEFLVGSAAGCDLRLPGSNLPPVVCQFLRSGESLRVRRLAESVAIAHNDQPLAMSTPIDLRPGDRLAIGPVEITVAAAASALLHPKMVPLDAAVSIDEKPINPQEELKRRQAALDEQARELEEDRRLWYRRRQEMEAEIERLRNTPPSAIPLPPSAAEDARSRELDERERELAAARQSLTVEYQSKRDELTRMLAAAQRETGQLAERRRAFEAEMAERRGEIEAAIASRRDEAEREFAARQRDVEAEIARRRLEFEADLRDYEPRLVQLRLEREQTEFARRSLENDRDLILALRNELTGERQALDAERGWQTERIEKQGAELDSREADLVRREEQLRHEKSTLEIERTTHKDDLVRLDRWQGTLEARQTLLDGRAAELDERLNQMRRDAADLEDQLRQASAEATRIRAESERLDRLKVDIDTQAAKFAERSAQVEAQQATLAVLRARLDRQQEELSRDTERLQHEREQQANLRGELDDKLRDAELLHAELGFLRDDNEAKQRIVQEQQSLLGTTLEDFRRQKAEVQAAEARLAEREAELDARSAETAEQAATLKAKLQQSLELMQRLEADRIALRERETALAEAEAARQALQEQLRKRADDLSGRGKNLDLSAREMAEERVVVERNRESIDEWKARAEVEIHEKRKQVEARAAELETQAAALLERESALSRQVERMKEVGAAIAAERKAVFDARQAWEAEQAANRQQALSTRHESEAFRSQVAEHVAELRRQAPELEHRASAALEKLAGAREVLRGHLAELHEYAKQSRQILLNESEQVRQREQMLEQAQAEHRLAVSNFRQQILDWQAKVAELKQAMTQQDSRVADRHADLDAAARRLEISQSELARRMAEIADEQRIANEKRNEMERHLADMREWYRQKLRALAAGNKIDDSDMPAWETSEVSFGTSEVASRPLTLPLKATSEVSKPTSEVDPADQQLGDLLKTRGLVDANALQALWSEARRQRKTLRQTLLASGAVTLYQLALIEAGNLDGLVMGRFRVIDRVRATPRETVYRVYDPTRPGVALMLRCLSEAESRDETHRQEFRERFAAATEANHANIANVCEVLDLNGRPAALQEAVSGLPSSDWPPLAATPGVWLRLVMEAARGLSHAHKVNLVHGRLAAESFVLTGDGVLKIMGFGEPGWLTGSVQGLHTPRSQEDLKSLGRVAFGWSQIGAKRRVGKGKPFPAELAAVIRRLEAGAESAMDDIIAIDRPYTDAAELLRDLESLALDHPCPNEAWTKLLASIGDDDEEEPLRATA